MRICIEGNIASSKSTLMQLLHQRAGYDVYPEPVHEWSEWLSLFYQDTKRWAFGFQLKVLSSFNRKYDGSPSIIERSMLSSRHVFGQLLFNQNLLADKEWDLFKTMSDMFAWQPDAIIYIQCPPEVCLQRMHARGRPAEARVSLDYLHKIDFMYSQMLKYFPGKVVCIDGNRPLEIVYEDVAAAVAELVQAKALKTTDDTGTCVTAQP